MGYNIGRAFSDAPLNSIERARDRALQGSPGTVTRKRNPRNTSLDETLARAAQDERENQVRRELGLGELGLRGTELGLKREQLGVETGLKRDELNRKTEADYLDLGHKMQALESLDGFRRETTDLRALEGADRAARYAERGEYERGVLGIREQEAAADMTRAQVAQEGVALRAAAENVRSIQQARELLVKARDLATRKDAMGQIDPVRASGFVPIIRDLEAFLRDPNGKNMPEDVSADARKARARAAAAAGLGGVDGEDDVDPMLDLGLDDFGEDDAPPRVR